MSERYLWDRSGPPDPLMRQLEQTLAPLAGKPVGPMPFAFSSRRSFVMRLRAPFAASAAVLAFFAWQSLLASRPQSAWLVIAASGNAHVNKSPLRGAAKVGINEWLETGADGRVELRVGQIGSVAVEPSSRMRVMRSESQQQRMELAVGEISAVIFAPPRLFVVQTPSATAVDLGCAYRLKMAPDGSGELSVTAGWVALERRGAEVYVPSGAACRIRPHAGPGVPWFRDASEEFRDAVRRWDAVGADQNAATSADATNHASEVSLRAFEDLIRSAVRRDTLTLWHLLGDASSAQRDRILTRIAEIASPRGGAAIRESREALLHGDAAAMSALRAALRQDW
ncbi:MAG: FecR domain-containing protein [Phycisphaerales bacterium]|nr:FecR domain-containing protein [Phycisphaerales bacterium]